MGTKGREMGIWNSVVAQEMKSAPEKREDGPELERKDDGKLWPYDEEKMASTGEITKKSKWGTFRMLRASFWGFLLLFSVFYYWRQSSVSYGRSLIHPGNEQTGESEPRIESSFEITVEELPLIAPVHTENLLSYSFGDSWGHPAQVSFIPYQGKLYNKVVLELSTNVTGLQHDRLGHIFIDNITVWRTSTVEPYDNTTIVSHSSKDITQYISLFYSDGPLNLTFQLDNLVTKKQTGAFNIDLKLHYYHEDKPKHGKDETATDFFYHYSTFPPDRVIPLVSETRKKTPLLYYPISSQSNPRWRRSLKDFFESDENLEHAVLEVFISGNAAEEFWYGNVLDKYVSKFKNSVHEVMGHGPFRALQIYLFDGENQHLVSSVVPTPIIYTGGYSPALWKPCVGIDAFDIESLSIDLTPFIPLLLEEKAWELQLEVVSSLSDEYKSTIGENWIISGNIKQWLSPEKTIDHSELKFNNFSSSFDVNVIERNPHHLHQAVNATSQNEVASLIKLDDKNYILSKQNSYEFTSNLTFFEDGDEEHTIVSIEKCTVISLYDESAYSVADPIISLTDKASWSLVVSVKLTEQDPTKSEITFKSGVGRTVDRLKYIKDYTTGEKFEIAGSGDLFKYYKAHKSTPHTIINAIQGSQVGSSEFTLSSLGNHGTGDSVHNVRVLRELPVKQHYKRDVIVSDNHVVFDVIKRDW